jgi:hypothetical protein
MAFPLYRFDKIVEARRQPGKEQKTFNVLTSLSFCGCLSTCAGDEFGQRIVSLVSGRDGSGLR